MRRILLPRFAIAAAVVAVACGDDGGPGGGGDFDPGAKQAQAEQLLTDVGENPAVRSLSIIGAADLSFSAVGVMQATLPTAMPTMATRETWATGRAALLRRVAPKFSTTGANIVIPTDVRGNVYTFNTSTGNYEESTQGGGPSNGVRFILYEVNASGTAPVTPLNDIGHLDLLDESSGSTNQLGIIAVIEGETLLDYTAHVSETTSSFSFGAEGFITDGTTQVNFDLDNSLTDTGIHILYSLSVEGEDTGVSLEVTADETGLSLEIEINADGDNLTLSAQGDETSFTGTVSFNGDVVAEFSGDAEGNAEFTDADGNPLSAEDVAALNSIFEFEGIFEVFDALLGPALLVMGVGLE
jgi:hypothetical protein